MQDLGLSPEYYPEKDKTHNKYFLNHCLLKCNQTLRITSAAEDKSQHD